MNAILFAVWTTGVSILLTLGAYELGGYTAAVVVASATFLASVTIVTLVGEGRL